MSIDILSPLLLSTPFTLAPHARRAPPRILAAIGVTNILIERAGMTNIRVGGSGVTNLKIVWEGRTA